MLKQYTKNEKLTHIDKEHRDHCLNLLRPHIYKLKNILELSHSNPWVLGIGKYQNKWYLSFCSLELASKYSTNSGWQRFFFFFFFFFLQCYLPEEVVLGLPFWAKCSLACFSSSGRASQVVLLVKNSPANAGDTRNMNLTPGLGRSPGEGNGSPHQFSCRGNPVPIGAWQAEVHEVPKSRTLRVGLSISKK